MRIERRYPIIRGRCWLDLLFNWGVVALAIYATHRIGFAFYPVALLIIGNRFLALFLMSHEAVHRNLMENPIWNDRFARYLCSFPLFASFNKYKRAHTFHHLHVGHEKRDPDYLIYALFPMTSFSFFVRNFWETVILKVPFAGLAYFSEWPELFMGKRNVKGKLFVFTRESDFVPYVIFQVVVFSLVLATGNLLNYALFVLVPVCFITIPYSLLLGGIQHGPPHGGPDDEASRTVVTPWWVQAALVPMSVSYHGEHHRNPSVPYYWLSTYSEDLAREGQPVRWRETYSASLGRLFLNTPYRENTSSSYDRKESTAQPARKTSNE